MVPKWLVFKALLDLRGDKIAQNGLRIGSFHLFVQPKWSKIIFRKTKFSPIFDPFFLVPKQPIFKAFCDFRGAKMAYNMFKMPTFHLGTPNAARLVLEKHILDPFLTHFGPKTAHFEGILGFLEGQNGPPQAQKTLVLASHVI